MSKTDWQDLLGDEWEDVEDEYGLHSNSIVSAFEVLSAIDWFSKVGEPLPGNEDADSLDSWEAAVAPLIAGAPHIGPNGHLLAPSERCIAIIESDEHKAHWEQARGDIYDYFGTSQAVDDDWPQERQDFISEYVYEFVSFLLAEIIGADTVGSTYFREMLSWFHAGRLPAGWSGDWPDGRPRVY